MLKRIAIVVLLYFLLMETMPLRSVSAKVVWKDIKDECEVEVNRDDTVEDPAVEDPAVEDPAVEGPAENLPESCWNIHQNNNAAESKIYTIQPAESTDPSQVYCDFEKGATLPVIEECDPSGEFGVFAILVNDAVKQVICEKGWMTVLIRYDGSLDFNKGFTEYEQGFGDVSNEHWAGLEFMHKLTSTGRWTLQVELTSTTGVKMAYYDDFSVGAAPGYELSLGEYYGNAGASMSYNAGSKFSTPDKDQDDNTDENCADANHGAWWYKGQKCTDVNILGFNFGDDKMFWKGTDTPMTEVQLKITPTKYLES